MHPTQDIESRPREEEQRTNRNVERTQIVLAEPLVVRTHPQDGQGTCNKSGMPQHQHKLIMMSVWPQAGHDNNTAVPGNSVFDAIAAMTQGIG
jgi:hypothetical protein